jgi:curved DNA-binding protein CbpA
MEGSTNRAEAERWLSIAERLLMTSDFHGAKSFAIRARDSDPRTRMESADQIIAVADTLIAGESRITDGQPNWYAILQLVQPTQSLELIATQFRRLAILLSPERNRLGFADQAFRLVADAWSVLSHPSKKADFDHALSIFLASESTQPQLSVRRSPRTKDGKAVPSDEDRPNFNHVTESTGQSRPTPEWIGQSRPTPESTRQSRPTPESTEQSRPTPEPTTRQSRPTPEPTTRQSRRPTPEPTTRQSRPTPESNRQSRPTPESTRQETRPAESESPSFWTACPYCYVLYEYPKVYEECTLRCQKCKMAFHAVMIPSPPVTDKDTYFCCWGFFPIGLTCNDSSGSSKWTPISPVFACPVQAAGGANRNVSKPKSAPRVYYDDQDALLEVSDSSEDSDDEWGSNRRKRKAKKRASASAYAKKAQNERVRKVQSNAASGETLEGSKAEASKKLGGGAGTRGAAELGKLDLNVEFSNEAEEPARGTNAGNGEEDNIEGIGFFEGLDEFLSSLPILKG